jgi:hypothetical protein
MFTNWRLIGALVLSVVILYALFTDGGVWDNLVRSWEIAFRREPILGWGAQLLTPDNSKVMR